MAEKVSTTESTSTGFFDVHGMLSHLTHTRKSLNLPYPGTIEQLSKEVQMDVQLTRQMFTGIKADITKLGGISPLFHVTQSFASGSQMLPAYSLAALYATNRVFMSGTADNDGSVQGRFHIGWAPANAKHTTKFMTQTSSEPGQSMLQVEHDWRGDDFNVNLKTINPSFLDGEFSGISIAHYLQSITSSLALGLEAVWQKPPSTAGPEEAALSYVGRYVQPTWIASAQVSPNGSLDACFWKKLSPKVEAGVECQLVKASGPMGQSKTEGVTTIAAKYDYLHSVLRGQFDTKGKLQCLFEKRYGAVTMHIATMLDLFKNNATAGIGINLELPTSDDPNMMQ